MDRDNRKILFEGQALYNNALMEEQKQDSDSNYSRYHYQNSAWFYDFFHKLSEIIKFEGKTIDEFINYVSTIVITPDQRKALHELRSEPMFIRLMGELALQQKQVLESLLGEITLQGRTFATEQYPVTAMKSVNELSHEQTDYTDQLDELFESGKITKEQCENYNQILDYIYSYFMSCSKGDQIPFRPMSNAEYESIEKKAEENGLDPEEQFRNETMYLRGELERIQAMQADGPRKR